MLTKYFVRFCPNSISLEIAKVITSIISIIVQKESLSILAFSIPFNVYKSLVSFIIIDIN